MWKCKACGLEILFRAVTPEIDEIGCFFVCFGCGHRNPLINVGGPGATIVLAQAAD